MKVKLVFAVAACAFVVGALATRVECRTRQDGQEGMEKRLTAPLLNAGIAIEPQSLISALQNEDLLIASRAALLLPRFPKTQEMVQALSYAVSDDREVVAVSAAGSLLKLNEVKWTPAAVERLPDMRDKVAQIQLAGFLARAGRAEGWPFVRAGIADERFTLVALENVEFFDRKTGPGGKPIRVDAELQKLLNEAPQGVRRQIEEKLKQVNKNARPK